VEAAIGDSLQGEGMVGLGGRSGRPQNCRTCAMPSLLRTRARTHYRLVTSMPPRWSQALAAAGKVAAKETHTKVRAVPHRLVAH